MSDEDAPRVALSVIVPALDEAAHLRAHLRRIVAAVEALGRSFEVILVDDGSRDATAIEAAAAARDDPRVRVRAHPENRGKGAALATGCREARGDVLVFLDADLEIAPEEIGPLLVRMEASGADVAVGSKYATGARQRRPWLRALLSRVYLVVTSLLFRLPIRDTQTGLKALRREVARALVPALRTRRWAWDVELLLLAHRAGARIVAAPVTVDFHRPGVRIGWRGFLDSGLDTLAVFVRDRGLATYGRALARARGPRGGRAPRTRFVLSGDDLGLAPAVDRGLLAAARGGRLTSLSYLVRGPTADAAARAALGVPGLDVGVHVDLAGGRLGRLLWRTALGREPARAIAAVVADDVAVARARGLVPTHVDAHRHAFFLPSTYRAVARAARRAGVPALRRPVPVGALRCGDGIGGIVKGVVLFVAGIATRGVPHAVGLAAPDGIVDAAVAARWAAARDRRLPRGTFEVVAHPVAGADDSPASERGVDRERDAVLLDTLAAALVGRGALLVGFPALAPPSAPVG